MAHLLHHLPLLAAERNADAAALTWRQQTMSYGALASLVERVAAGLLHLGIERGERVAVYLDKRFETVAAIFGAARAGAVFVPVNPLLKADQVAHILRDCNVRVIVTGGERLQAVAAALSDCADLRHVVTLAHDGDVAVAGKEVVHWDALVATRGVNAHRVIDTDMAAILYTSGSTGKPKGVVLSHRNMVAGAQSVAGYLANRASDTILSVLPLAFDAGFSQLTTGFHAGARIVLLNYLLPRDVLVTMAKEHVTGVTAVPPLWIQLSQLPWPPAIAEHLRYFANTGGRMPLETLTRLRRLLPRSQPFLMYGLTEAFRSTFLPPEEVDRRPDSIGKAIPNAEILVLRPDGTHCDADEPGELVHRGALVGMGYWNDRAKTAERYKPLPIGVGGRESGMMLDEIAVYSGDTVKRDADGFLYFIGRRDEMIKTSGYRVSPTEIEETLYSSGLVGEVAAFGVDDVSLGQAIVVIATPVSGTLLAGPALVAECRKRLPPYMVPAHVEITPGPLPRNPNGKIDRKTLAAQYEALLGMRADAG